MARHRGRAAIGCVGLRAGSGVYEAIRESKDLGDEVVAKLDEALKSFVEGFNIEEERGLAG